MRSVVSTHTPAPLERTSVMTTPPLSQVPTIRLTTATPAAADACTKTKHTATILTPKAQGDSRKRLVPKKSKLSLLGGSKKEKGKDFSDLARRVGAPSPTMGRSFDIYIDPADDPDIGEIIVLKKKKSRAGLNDLHWGTLGDVTNTGKEQVLGKNPDVKRSSPLATSLAAKDDEKEKWWTLGRSRKDSKEKQKDRLRSKSKEKLKPKEITKENPTEPSKNSMKRRLKSRGSISREQGFEARQRSQSLDAGIIFSPATDLPSAKFISVPMPDDEDETPRRGHSRSNTSPSLYDARRVPTVTQLPEEKEYQKNGSIALRAMRSVRSLARIGSWAQLTNMPTEDAQQQSQKGTAKSEDKEAKKRERTKSTRSSFGALKNTLGSVRKSVDWSGTIRSVSSQATAVSNASDITVRNSSRHSGSTLVSTIRYDSPDGAGEEPIVGRASKSSTSSTIRSSTIRWNDQINISQEHNSPSSESSVSRETENVRRSKKRSPELRRRPRLSSLFSDLRQETSKPSEPEIKAAFPVQAAPPVALESEAEISATLLDISSVTSLDSPSRRVRPRPLSEQMLGRERPKGIIGDKDTGVIRILDDVTTDLASLINRLDLEATPTASPVVDSPGNNFAERPRVDNVTTDSPVKKPLKQKSMEKLLGTLKAYTQRRKYPSVSAIDSLGKQIAPWPETMTESDTSTADSQPSFYREQKRSLSLSTSPPAPHEADLAFYPLPAPSRPGSEISLSQAQNDICILEVGATMPSSFATFGKRRSKGSQGSNTPTVAKRRRTRGGRGSSVSQDNFNMSFEDDVFADSKTRQRTVKRATLGSIGAHSISADVNDPNYDIPGELRMLLGESAVQDTAFTAPSDHGSLFEASSAVHPLPPSPGTPPNVPLPPIGSSRGVFRALPSELSEFNDDAFIASDDENETQKSFDFTAELRKLDCVDAADNKSFIKQLDEAFRTPKKYSIRGLGSKLGLGVHDLVDSPVQERTTSVACEIALPESPPTSEPGTEEFVEATSLSERFSLDALPNDDIRIKQPSQVIPRTVFSRPSQGHLDSNFRFGGVPSKGTEITRSSNGLLSRSDIVPASSEDSRDESYSYVSPASSRKPMTTSFFTAPMSSSETNQSCSSFNSAASGRPMTLSDIIPPPSHDSRRLSYCSVNEEESVALQSIFARADNLSDFSLGGASRCPSPSNARDRALGCSNTHSRHNSDVSFSGLSCYSEIRRGFEYGASRPTFYPPAIPEPPADKSLLVPTANWRNSILSLGSVSSYGRVTRAGAKDPFDYSVPARPISEDMSYTVDDTFSFMHEDPIRQRADSGASNYSFASHLRPDVYQRRTRRQVESVVSVTSGPPVSLYNRGFNVGRTSFTWRQRTSSFESIASGFSAHHLGRPGVGDKMFESARDLGVPLASISASPGPSQMESSMNWHTSFDSIVDGDRDQDSLMDETGRQSLLGSQESLFGNDNHYTQNEAVLRPPPQFRPVSLYSVNSIDSSKGDDDTMISMLGGGYVRRRSIRSTLEGSPCARVEKRQKKRFLGRMLSRIPSGDAYDFSVDESPDKARLTEEPSLASALALGASDNCAGQSPGDASFSKSPSNVSIPNEANANQESDAVKENDGDNSRLSLYDASFGSSRMSLARKGLLERHSLEDCCLSGEGEESTNTRQSLVAFRRPEPAARKRSVSTGIASSGADTPPLSRSRSSSAFTGSQHSIDLDRLNAILSGSLDSSAESDRERLRRRGNGHRRRISEARASRASSIYATIDEAPEFFNVLSSSGKHAIDSSVTANLPISDSSIVQWDNEDVGPALRMIQTLRNEACLAVDASRRQWADTAYSVDMLQSFQPPKDPEGWKALLEHSQKSFGPLPPEFHGCARRSRARTVSRPSPYPRSRVFTRPPSIHMPVVPSNIVIPEIRVTKQVSQPLRDVSANPNVTTDARVWEPLLGSMRLNKPFSSELSVKANQTAEADKSSSTKLPISETRSRVLSISSARKLMPGTAKRNAAKSPRKAKENKENIVQGPSNRMGSSRFVRPRPPSRPSAIPRTLRI